MKNLTLITKTAGAALVLAAGLMTGCGSSSDGDGGSSVKTGTFEDAAVAGIHYKTATQEGTTDADGQFKFKAGETVTFSIGSKISFSGIPQGTIITPAHLAGTEQWDTNRKALNIIRFLMSVDANQDLTDGIQIPEGLADFADENIEADFMDFSQDLDDELSDFMGLATLTLNTGYTFTLVDDEQAKEHFTTTIEGLGIDIEIQISTEAVPCSDANTAAIEDAYSGNLSSANGGMAGPVGVQVEGTNLYIAQNQVEAKSCTFAQSKLAIKGFTTIYTDTWVWTEGSNIYTITDSEDVLSINIVKGEKVSSAILTQAAD